MRIVYFITLIFLVVYASINMSKNPGYFDMFMTGFTSALCLIFSIVKIEREGSKNNQLMLAILLLSFGLSIVNMAILVNLLSRFGPLDKPETKAPEPAENRVNKVINTSKVTLRPNQRKGNINEPLPPTCVVDWDQDGEATITEI